jgi:hypothetical protein
MVHEGGVIRPPMYHFVISQLWKLYQESRQRQLSLPKLAGAGFPLEDDAMLSSERRAETLLRWDKEAGPLYQSRTASFFHATLFRSGATPVFHGSPHREPVKTPPSP